MNKTFNIGEAAKESGVHAKMIRHYEEIGVIPKAMRTDAGYRLYREQDIHTLRFVRNARDLGFSMKEIKKLLSLWKNKSRTSSEVKKLATLHIQALRTKISELKSMVGSLETLIQHCSGDERPECPILKGLGSL